MAGIGTIGTTVIGTTVIGATGKLGQIRATALNEQVRAASFAKALLLIRQKSRRRVGKIGDGFSQCDNASPSNQAQRVSNAGNECPLSGEDRTRRVQRGIDAIDRAPRGRELSVREGLTRINVDWSGSWQASRPGNWLGRSPSATRYQAPPRRYPPGLLAYCGRA